MPILNIMMVKIIEIPAQNVSETTIAHKQRGNNSGHHPLTLCVVYVYITST